MDHLIEQPKYINPMKHCWFINKLFLFPLSISKWSMFYLETVFSHLFIFPFFFFFNLSSYLINFFTQFFPQDKRNKVRGGENTAKTHYNDVWEMIVNVTKWWMSINQRPNKTLISFLWRKIKLKWKTKK
jgi:hypothetical protein